MARTLGYTLADDALEALQNAISIPAHISVFYDWLAVSGGLTKIAVIDMGELQIVTVPGEPLSSFCDRLKPLLPGPACLFFSITDDQLHYIVPEDQWEDCTATFLATCYEETLSEGRPFASRLAAGYQMLFNNLAER